MQHKKLIISVAPTGNRLQHHMHPYVPISEDEIAEDLMACCEAGASIAHVHVRNRDETPSNNPDKFQKVWDKLEEADCPIIRQASLAGGKTTNYKLLDILETDADMASLGMGSINYLNRVNLFEPEFISVASKRMRDKNIFPELEIFDSVMVENAMRYFREGYLESPLKFNFIFDAPGTMAGTPRNLMFQVNSLPENALWGISAMGESHVEMIAMAMAMGGHIRVGLEDCIADTSGKPMSNVEQVKRVGELAHLMGREVATCEEVRSMLKLKKGKGENMGVEQDEYQVGFGRIFQ